MKGGCEEIRLPVIGPSVGRETRREDEWDINPIYSVCRRARRLLARSRKRYRSGPHKSRWRRLMQTFNKFTGNPTSPEPREEWRLNTAVFAINSTISPICICGSIDGTQRARRSPMKIPWFRSRLVKPIDDCMRKCSIYAVFNPFVLTVATAVKYHCGLYFHICEYTIY